MPDVKVYFIHPTNGRRITVNCDVDITAAEAINEMLSADFIAPNPQGYNLAIKGGAQLLPNCSFQQAGVKNGDTIRVIPATDAG